MNAAQQIKPGGLQEWSLTVLLVYCGLVIVWQISGVVLLASGLRAPGPAASLSVAGISLIIAGGLILTSRYLMPGYYVLCAFLLWGAASTIHNAFTADPALWPSDWLRYCGVLINLIGVAGALLGLGLMVRPRAAQFRSNRSD